MYEITCVRCSYSLMGLAGEAVCPECGTAVADSMEQAGVLHKRELAELACRLFALWAAVQLLVSLAPLTWSVGYLINGQGGDYWGLLFNSILTAMIYGLFAGVLWCRPSWIVRRLFRQDGIVSVGGRLVSEGLVSVAFTAIGLILVLVWGFVPLLTDLVRIVFVGMVRANDRFWVEVFHSVGMTVFGLLLLIWTGAFVRFVGWLGAPGTRRRQE